MKHPTSLMQNDARLSKYPSTRRYCLVAALCALMCLSGGMVSAATITKADTADNLDQGTSWVGGLPPTSADVGLFDATLAGANVTFTLNQDTNWAGLQLTAPAAALTINAGNTLSLGASGIDMSAASQDLTLGCNVGVLATQNWNIASG